MRIDRLDLMRFGPFTGAALDLSGGSQGLHLVFGPNEAGKSSTLRALRCLLYGFPNSTSDNFLHKYDQLRIGGRLLLQGGRSLEFIRRKSKTNSLRAADDQAVIDDDQLAGFLGGVDAEAFVTMFGIDHPTLVEAGKNIAKGSGRIGELLFAAGAGLLELRSLQTNLQAEIDALYKPTGQLPRINQSLKRLKESRESIKAAQLSVDDWAGHDQAVRNADKRLAEVGQSLAAKRGELDRLVRIQVALGPIGRRKQLLEALVPLADLPLLPENFGEQRVKAATALEAATTQEAEATKRLAQLAADDAEQDMPGTFLAAADDIKRLSERLGSHRKAMQDRPGLVTTRTIVAEQALELLKSLGHEPRLDDVETLRLRRDEIVRIRSLANQKAGLVQALKSSLDQGAKCRREQAVIAAELERTSAPSEAAALRSTLKRVRAEGNLEQQHADRQAEVARLSADLDVRLAQLSVAPDQLEQFERLDVPEEETIARHDRMLVEMEARLAAARARAVDAERTLAGCEERLRDLGQGRNVPSVEQLAEARARREHGWQLVLEAWRGRGKEPPAAKAFVAESNAADLAEAYEQAVAAADRLADRLRDEADAVARQASLQRERDQKQQARDAAHAERVLAETEHAEAVSAWNGCWQPLGITPRSPKEMSGWLRRREGTLKIAADLRAKRSEADKLCQRIAAARAELARVLPAEERASPKGLSENHDPLTPGPSPARGEGSLRSGPKDETLAAQLGRAEDVLEALHARQSRRDELLRNQAAAQARLVELEAAAERDTRNLEAWTQSWAAAMQPLRRTGDTTPDEANSVVDALDELFEKLQSGKATAARVEGIDEDARVFAADVEQFARRLAPELTGRPVESIVDELSARLTSALAAKEGRNVRQREREKHVKQRDDATRRRSESEATLKTLAREARCERLEELRDVEEKSTKCRELKRQLNEVEERLLDLARGQSLDALVEDVQREQPQADSLPGRIESLRAEIAGLDTEEKDLRETRGREKAELDRMTGGDDAADKAEEQQSIVASLEDDLRQLVVLRLTNRALHKSIERYSEQNQGPILTRASEVFGKLTGGSFIGLRTDIGDKNQPILKGLRPEGTTVEVEGMSDGTADQLYLALRLASLEHWFASHEAIPFIVDDILLNFDDRRAAAALECLADLSRHTQVIMFTHHQHLVELARDQVDGERLLVHELPRC